MFNESCALSLNRSIPVPSVIQQHAEETAILRNVRSKLVKAPHAKLMYLRRLDDRIAAHLDGVAVAGEYGWRLCEDALENPGVGELFAASVRAIEEKQAQRLDKLAALCAAMPEVEPGLVSAFGWVDAPHLKGTVARFLRSTNPFQQSLGIAACALHRVDPGAILSNAIVAQDPKLRARALLTAGEVGLKDFLPACFRSLNDEVPACRFWAAYSAILLGSRERAMATLATVVSRPGPFHVRALRLFTLASDSQATRAQLKKLSETPAEIRTLIRAIGYAGDTYYVPWLIKQMNDANLARLAGESFSFITGADLAWLDLEGNAPEGFESGPNDDPNDDNVAIDEDEDLPWPDPVKVEAWWAKNSDQLQSGTRYFVGAQPTGAHCLSVLKEGYQRQRIAAALYLCLLKPGSPLFNTAAPAWRQEAALR